MRFKSPKTLLVFNGILVASLIVFLMVAFFLVPNQTADQRSLIRLLFPLLAGFAVGFMTGTALLELKSPPALGWRIAGSFSAGIATFVLTYLLAPQVLSDARPDGPPVATEPVKVGILYPSDMSYGRNIKDGFTSSFKKAFPNARFTENVVQGNVLEREAFASNQFDKADWFAKQEAEGKLDLLVAVGTQAAETLRGRLGARFGITPFIFAGITDPVASGLVSRLTDRNDVQNVAGISYGSGIDGLISLVHDAFPNKKIFFIYRSGVKQDEYVVHRLEKSPLVTSGILKIKKINHPPAIGDFADVGGIYVSWYTLEALFESGAGMDILKSRIVIATTEENVGIDGLSPICIAPDDVRIGESVTQLYIKHVRTKDSLGTLDVVVPAYGYTVNLTTCVARKIKLSRYILDSSKKIGAVDLVAKVQK